MAKNKLWIVERQPDYDEYGDIAVIAEDEECARQLAYDHAAGNHGSREAGDYLNQKKTTVRQVPLTSESVVLAYMLHG